MLTSIAIILLFGLLVGWIFSKMKLPSLLGMIIVGIVLSPHCLNLVDDSILTISGDLRQIALVIILTRAGLSLNFSDLKKVGRPAILMCFVPACIEMMGTIIFAPLLLGVSILDITGTAKNEATERFSITIHPAEREVILYAIQAADAP